MDGLAAAREITADGQAAVLILTAFSQRNLIEEARDAGRLAYLIKPFTQAELVPAIEVALGRFQEMQAIKARTPAWRSSSRPGAGSTGPRASSWTTTA